MDYSYDRRNVLASTAPQILRMIVQKALADRSVVALIQAYMDELEEDWEETHEDGEASRGSTPEDYRRWQTKVLGLLHTEAEVEKVMTDTFVATYRRFVRHPVTREEALDVFVLPQGFPTERVPRPVAVAVAEAMAHQDARDTNALHSWAKAKHEQGLLNPR